MLVTGQDTGYTVLNESLCSPGVCTLLERDRKCTNKQLNIMIKVVKIANKNNFGRECCHLFYLRWPRKSCLPRFIFFPKVIHLINRTS